MASYISQINSVLHSQGGGRFGMGAKPQGVWGRESPVGSRGEALLGGLGDEVPPEAEKF